MVGGASAVTGWESADAMVAADTWDLTPPSPATKPGDHVPAARRGDCEAFLSILDTHDRMLRSLAFPCCLP